MEAEVEAAKVFEENSGSGSRSGAKDLEAEAEAFLEKRSRSKGGAVQRWLGLGGAAPATRL